MKKTAKNPQSTNTEEPAQKPAAERSSQIDLALRRSNRSLKSDALLEKLRVENPELYAQAEVVGSWVWIQFQDKQAPEITSVISQYGFHWNTKRQAWQHPCGTLPEENQESQDPRKRFRSYFAADEKAA